VGRGSDPGVTCTDDTIEKIRRAFEKAGIKFINGKRPGGS